MITEMQLEELSEILRKNVRSRRKELGDSQADVAERSGITQEYVTQIESGSRIPTLKVLASLATALGTTPSALLSPEIFSSSAIDE
jgi:transcriptional regulator with XRE-family HTH domain